jgi:hypothetical protein
MKWNVNYQTVKVLLTTNYGQRRMNTGTNKLRPTVTTINSVMFARTAIPADTARYVQ